MLKEKTCFPYEWLNKDIIYNKELPSIDKFYSSLKLQNITKEEYNKTIDIYIWCTILILFSIMFLFFMLSVETFIPNSGKISSMFLRECKNAKDYLEIYMKLDITL